jgi:DNA modification methylase
MADVETYISLEDAVELTGYSAARLRRMIREGVLTARGGRDAFIPWSEVQRLASTQRPPWLLVNESTEYHPSFVLDRWDRQGSDSTSSTGSGCCLDSITSGHCIDWLAGMPGDSIQTVITSPPYWGQRRYADEQPVQWMDGEWVAYGREATVEAYLRHSLEILRHLKRVLRTDGTIWWVMGDTYQTRTIVRPSTVERWEGYQGKRRTVWAANPDRRHSAGHDYLKDKDLTLVPFLVANGAQHIGLYVRSIIIWSKETDVEGEDISRRRHMPEPVGDRPTTGHEYILLLSKTSRYLYSGASTGNNGGTASQPLRTVWSFPVSTNHGGHTAAFPLELARRCVQLTSRPGDLVADPFSGSGNTLIAAKELGRHYIGCDISPTYVDEAEKRLARIQVQPSEASATKSG